MGKRGFSKYQIRQLRGPRGQRPSKPLDHNLFCAFLGPSHCGHRRSSWEEGVLLRKKFEIWIPRFRGEGSNPLPGVFQNPSPSVPPPPAAPRPSPALTSRPAGWGEAALGSGLGSAGGSGAAAGAEEEAPDAAQKPGTPECPCPAHSAPRR